MSAGRTNSWIIFVTALAMLCTSCGDNDADKGKEPRYTLPFFGEHDVEIRHASGGELIPDTTYYRIPYFSYINQGGRVVSHEDFMGKIFVADFFFTHCESICPIMSSQMARLQERLRKDGLCDRIRLLSHTVDPSRDTPERLKEYSTAIGADTICWQFVTGRAEDIYWQAETGYMLSAFPSDTAQGGFFHTDRFTLVDRFMRIRGYYDGTSTKEVDQLFEDIQLLIKNEADGRE